MKKFMSILLAITIIMSFAVIASAKDTTATPAVCYTEQCEDKTGNNKDVIVNIASALTQSEDEETKVVNPDTDPTNPMNWVKTILNAVISFTKGIVQTAIAYIKGEKVVTNYPFWWSQAA